MSELHEGERLQKVLAAAGRTGDARAMIEEALATPWNTADLHAADGHHGVSGLGAPRGEVRALLLSLGELHAGLEDLLEESLERGVVERAGVGRHQRVEHLLLAHGVVL